MLICLHNVYQQHTFCLQFYKQHVLYQSQTMHVLFTEINNYYYCLHYAIMFSNMHANKQLFINVGVYNNVFIIATG